MSKIKVFLFSFAIFGYGVISFLISDASSSRRVTVPYRLIILILSFCVVLFSLNNTNQRVKLQKNTSFQKTANLLQIVFFILFIFIFVYSLRLLFETSVLDNLLINPSSEYLLRWFGMCLLPGLSFLFINSKQSQSYLNCSWLFLTITSLLALQFDPQQSRSFTEQGRLATPGLDPISLAHTGVSLVLLSTFIFFQNKKKIIGIAFQGICLLTLFIGCYIIFLGASRGPTISLFFCMVLLFIGAIHNGTKPLKFSVLLLAGLIGLASASGLAVRIGSSFLYRLSGIFAPGSGINPTDSVRIEWLQTSKALIWDNLMLGYGLELPGIGYPHNIIVEAFLTTGILGGIIFTAIYLYSVGKAISLIINAWETWGWLGLIYIQHAIATVLSGALSYSDIFWYLLFAVMSRRKLNHNSLEKG